MRTYIVLEDRETLDWVERDDRFGLVPWPPSADTTGGTRYGNVVDLLSALARSRALPDVVFLDDAVPRAGGEQRVMDAHAAAVASGIRHMAASTGSSQPRIVVITATAIDGQDLLAMLELGADDVVAKSDLASPDARTAYRHQLRTAVDPRLPRSHATNAMQIKARRWPPPSDWPADVDVRIRSQLTAALPLLPLWEANIADDELVNRHLLDSRRQILPDARGINRHYLRRAEGRARRPGWLLTKLKDRRAPLAGIVAEGARDDGLLWVREATRNRARDLPWHEILPADQSWIRPPDGHAPFASTTDPRVRELLYPRVDDPRHVHGGEWIYRLRRT